MNSGQNKNRNVRHSRPSSPYANRSNRGSSSRGEPQNFQSAQRNYERYLTLAQAEVLSGNAIGAENYYQHAEHYFRMMSSDKVTT